MIAAFKDLQSIREEHQDKKIVFARGAFDLVHIGHLEFVTAAKSHGDILVIGISSDEKIKQAKGSNRPIQSENNRLALINGLRPVDYAFIMPPETNEQPTRQVVKTLMPDYFVEYFDVGSDAKKFAKDLEQFNTKLIIDESKKRDSTSAIIQRVKNDQTAA